MVWGAIAAAGASLGGGLLQRRDQKMATKKQMEFQERMSSTAYQRGMADMRLAGLNPILAYKQGGASTPTGQTWQAQNIIGKAASSGLAAYQTIKQTENVSADTRLKNEQATLTQMQAATAREVIRIKKADADMAEEYGPSPVTRAIGSGVRTAKTWWDSIQDALKPGSPRDLSKQPSATLERLRRKRGRTRVRTEWLPKIPKYKDRGKWKKRHKVTTFE